MSARHVDTACDRINGPKVQDAITKSAVKMRLRDAAPELLAACEAQEEASAFALNVSAATPDGAIISKLVMDQVEALFARAERLRRAAIAKAKGGAA